jgi:hypothetical protein
MRHHGSMSAPRLGSGSDQDDTGSWAMESLPMAVRKELLERELRKLGFRRDGSGQSVQQQQQQPQGPNPHPQADADRDSHAD